MEEINAARATIEQLTKERNELDKNSISYAQIHTNITNDIVARTTLLNTLISQQGNSFPDLPLCVVRSSSITMDNLQKRILSNFVYSVTQTRSKLLNIFDGLLVAYDTLSRSIATSLLRRHDLSLRAQLLVRSSLKYESMYCNHRIIDMGKIHACFPIPDNLHDQLEQLKTNEGGEINIQYVWDDQSSTFHVHG